MNSSRLALKNLQPNSEDIIEQEQIQTVSLLIGKNIITVDLVIFLIFSFYK